MKILVFGTGSAALLYIKKSKEFFENVEILAFLDNNSKRWGNLIYEKEIISPCYVDQYDYDVILICSIYEDEICEQLIYQIKVCKEKIYTRRNFFEQIIFPWYDKRYNLYNKKILIITEDCGTYKQYRKYFGMYLSMFNIIDIIGVDEINLIHNYNFDYIFITNFHPILKNRHNVNLTKNITNYNKILTGEIFDIYLTNIKEVKYGNKYCDKKFLVIRPYGCFIGLGAIILMVAKSIKYAKENGYIPIVDMQYHQTQYLEDDEYGKVNAYTKFFEQPSKYDLDDIKNANSVSFVYGVRWLSKKEEQELLIPNMHINLYKKYYEFKKKFNNKKVLGVLFRGTDYANLKPFGHNIQPDLCSMIKKVKEKICEWGKFDLIYLCTEVKEACDCFEDEFGKDMVCYYSQIRYKSDTKEYLSEINLNADGHTEQGKAYLIALHCLAACNSIIAGQCNGTKIALMINNHKYQNEYLFKLGKYGIDDIKNNL